jgi:excinuclease UvrABC nuclease subunit
MLLSDLKNLEIPKTPGVYLFKKGGEILYIGKATSLADRTKSYFGRDLIETRGPRIVQMVEEADTLEWQESDSVLEAVILEAKLIKKHLPPANVKEKDDKSYKYVVITKEEFPRVLLVRGKELFGLSQDDQFLPEKLEASYGPFPKPGELKEALAIVRKIFPFRDTCEIGSKRPCFNARIGLCPGVCAGLQTPHDYKRQIRHIKLFFEGHKKDLVKELTHEMNNFARDERFEEAARARNQIFALEHIQDVALLKREKPGSREGYRIEGYDVAHISGTALVGVMTVATGGELDKAEYRKFKIRLTASAARQNDDNKSLSEILTRRLKHTEWKMPDLIVVDGSTAQKNTAERIIAEQNLSIPVVGVVKNEHHRPSHIIGESAIVKDHKIEILLVNAEAHRFAITYHKKLRDTLPKKKI